MIGEGATMAKPSKAAWLDAIKYGKVDVVAAGIRSGYDVHAEIQIGKPPLGLAGLFGQLETAKVLVEAGANVNQQYGDGETPLAAAANEGHFAVVDYLLECGAKARQSGENSPLMMAVLGDTAGHVKVARRLIEAGAEVNQVANTAVIIVAAMNGLQHGFITELAARGADLNYVDPWWGTPLHTAIQYDNDRGVQELVECGADCRLKAPAGENNDWSGLTPLELAQKRKKKKIVALLEAAGGKKASSAKRAKPAAATSRPATKTKVPTVPNSWNHIEQRLKPKALQSLQKGASARQIEAVEKKIRATLTKDVKDYFARHDGQTGGPAVIPTSYTAAPAFRLLPIKDGLSQWRTWCELEEGGDFEDLQVTQDDAVRPTWWHNKWFPIATDTLGNFLCLDFAPAKSGKKGQVIRVDHDGGRRPVVADSVRVLLADVADELS